MEALVVTSAVVAPVVLLLAAWLLGRALRSADRAEEAGRPLPGRVSSRRHAVPPPSPAQESDESVPAMGAGGS